ncbi:hypothetical protein [Bradyrhizobium sp. 25ACV]
MAAFFVRLQDSREAIDNILVNGSDDDAVRPKKPCSLIKVPTRAGRRRQRCRRDQLQAWNFELAAGFWNWPLVRI